MSKQNNVAGMVPVSFKAERDNFLDSSFKLGRGSMRENPIRSGSVHKNNSNEKK